MCVCVCLCLCVCSQKDILQLCYAHVTSVGFKHTV